MTLFADPAYPEVAIMFALLVMLPLGLREAERVRVRLVQRHRQRAALHKSRRD